MKCLKCKIDLNKYTRFRSTDKNLNKKYCEKCVYDIFAWKNIRELYGIK